MHHQLPQTSEEEQSQPVPSSWGSTDTTGWHAGANSKHCEDCSWVAGQEVGSIYLTPEIWAVVKKICGEIKDEWQILLCGKEEEGIIYISEYIIPLQEVTGSTVTNNDCIDDEYIREHKVLATMHSHSTMGVFFSKTDENHTNFSQIDYHIVVNNKGQKEACRKMTLPCGMMKLEPIDVVIFSDTPEVEVVGLDNITKKSRIIYGSYNYNKDRKTDYADYYHDYNYQTNKEKIAEAEAKRELDEALEDNRIDYLLGEGNAHMYNQEDLFL